ncbi:sulfurtransferase complex subunit TusD [Enterobacteriaceae endosymbiont of Donacia versicolorea]|uniref:sulfurtransferase complex subunit TusD n=1 Tax=Enterobacteriaceae endosymbiont of Donacia versicolorea TaxID=2675788 RepID=UPI001448FD6D|nr:sulfurtransferase complex subunit TusD [Enterobacteriaceae endosymbiont of Donacia versicolorea]QJC32182.1 sulfurtransferase complex subunit TusD [Enterobacteriaceae endosymbiont of Donacia versicolorea]
MIFIILVTGAPFNTQNSYSAYLFVNAVIKKKNFVQSVFFYRDGVCNANKNVKFNEDEFNLIYSWEKLSKKYHINLYICITSAKKRGLIKDNYDQVKILNYQSDDNIINNRFKITTLSTLAKSILTCNRLVQF